jgi:hypothetical protein
VDDLDIELEFATRLGKGRRSNDHVAVRQMLKRRGKQAGVRVAGMASGFRR